VAAVVAEQPCRAVARRVLPVAVVAVVAHLLLVAVGAWLGLLTAAEGVGVGARLRRVVAVVARFVRRVAAVAAVPRVRQVVAAVAAVPRVRQVVVAARPVRRVVVAGPPARRGGRVGHHRRGGRAGRRRLGPRRPGPETARAGR
jgi:hypothetical protein